MLRRMLPFLLAVCRRLNVELPLDKITQALRTGPSRVAGGPGTDDDLPRIPPALHRGQRGLLGGAGEARSLGEAAGKCSTTAAALRPWFVGERPTSAITHSTGTWQRAATEGARLHLHGDRRGEELQLPRAPPRSAARGGDDALARVGKGDRVVVYMPMIPEAAFVILAARG